jgi:TatD DNase family protein
MWIDSHCHITHKNIAEAGDVATLVANAAAQKVDGMLVINCRIVEELPHILSAIAPHKNLWCTVGTHPHDAGRADEKTMSEDDIHALISNHPAIIGVGESGLDYHYNFSTPEDQHSSFRKHIRVCRDADIPLVVHAREADDDIIRLIKEETNGKGMRGIMHSFSSSEKMCDEALELGFHISFSGMITFKKADELRCIAAKVPLDRLLVETDAPYLAPEPYRGKINQPSFVVYTGEKLAQIKNISVQEMASITTQNFFRLFTRAKLA